MRALVLWCPDWPVVAALAAQSTGADSAIQGGDRIPVAVQTANRIVACSAAARAEGVRQGQRKREAQARCPDLVTLPHDPAVAARIFEPVVTAVEAVAPGVEIVRPGLCAVRAKGPARYFKGEAEAAARLAGTVLALGYECHAGIADGVFAAALAARQELIVPPGKTAEFLASFPVEVLDRPELADLLRRLGVRTLGAFAALPASDVLARFGADGAHAHRLATGREERPLAARNPPSDLTVRRELDPPVNRVDTAAFHAKAAAEDLVTALSERGLVATSVDIAVQTHDSRWLSRRWRHDGAMTAADVADRARWQIEGWLTGTALSQFDLGDYERPHGLVVLRLEPVEAIPAGEFPTALWGGPGEHDERARRAVNRVHSLLGHGAVVVPVLSGGRGPADAVELIPWGDQRTPSRPPPGLSPDSPPWPGRLPPPSPATVLPTPKPVAVLDAAGTPVRVSGRGTISVPPAMVGDGDGRHEVRGWAGPWPVEERWWDPRATSRIARFQVTTDTGTWLLSLQAGRWLIEAVYD